MGKWRSASVPACFCKTPPVQPEILHWQKKKKSLSWLFKMSKTKKLPQLGRQWERLHSWLKLSLQSKVSVYPNINVLGPVASTQWHTVLIRTSTWILCFIYTSKISWRVLLMGMQSPRCPPKPWRHSFTYFMLCDGQREALMRGHTDQTGQLGSLWEFLKSWPFPAGDFGPTLTSSFCCPGSLLNLFAAYLINT